MSTASAETPATRSLDSMLISIRQNEARRRDPKLGKGQLVGIPSEELARGGGRGALLERAQGDKKHRYELEGWPVKTGTLIEVYTNVVNRWIRGRFDGRTDEPKLVIQILDPNGPWDESGLNPQVGTWEVPVFEGAICRWPPR